MNEMDTQAGREASGAEISACGRYRYKLWRHWDASITALPIIMLNPSTADASIDDPTIRRCIAFAKREGFGGIHVVNLFPFRATSPTAMRAEDDPWGPQGNYALEEVLQGAVGPVLAAWGAHGGHRGHDAMVMLSAKGHGTKMVCLGTTKDGHPRHPLYVKGDQPFVRFPRPELGCAAIGDE